MSRFALISPPHPLRAPLVTALSKRGWAPVLVRVWDQEPLSEAAAIDRVADLSDFRANVDVLNGCSCALLFIDTLEHPIASIRALLSASDEAGLGHIICVTPKLPVNHLPGSGASKLDALWFAQQECLRFKTQGAPLTLIPSTQSIEDFSDLWTSLDRFL